MELEVGMYVRTNLGIAKIISFKKNYLGNEFLLDKEIIDTHEDYYTNCMYDYKFYLEQIIKTSHNIIDLIEVEDYVNGKHIDEIDIHRKRLYSYERDDYYIFFERDIISIVTREQFESMAYKIGD